MKEESQPKTAFLAQKFTQKHLNNTSEYLISSNFIKNVSTKQTFLENVPSLSSSTSMSGKTF